MRQVLGVSIEIPAPFGGVLQLCRHRAKLRYSLPLIGVNWLKPQLPPFYHCSGEVLTAHVGHAVYVAFWRSLCLLI